MFIGVFRVCFSMNYYCFIDGVLRDQYVMNIFEKIDILLGKLFLFD